MYFSILPWFGLFHLTLRGSLDPDDEFYLIWLFEELLTAEEIGQELGGN